MAKAKEGLKLQLKHSQEDMDVANIILRNNQKVKTKTTKADVTQV